MPTESQPICLVTGTGGYLGSRVKAALEQRGWHVRELTRQPRPGSDAKSFQLGEDVAPATLAGAKALVHCAYDFTQFSWDDIQRVNVAGSEKLLRAAREAKVETLVYISSISAFDGCVAMYGRAKLATEKIAQSLGARIVRPGLIWGDPPGATFGRLAEKIERTRWLPLFGGGQIQYLVHEQDLAAFIADNVEGEIPASTIPVTVANEQPWTFREILGEIARSKHKTVSFIPLPWQLVWLGLKCAEACGLRPGFRSDAVVSLMNQNPAPSFAEQRERRVGCRPFELNRGSRGSI
jgi:nucleoside-diphosphate-sugar epimerase